MAITPKEGVRVSRWGSRRVTPLLACMILLATPANQPWAGPLRDGPSPGSSFLSARSMSPSQGKFLVSKREMRDPRFAQTVVLLIEHGEKGTMGLVINRRTKLTLSEALPQLESRAGRSEFLFMGGPVQVQAISVLLRSKSQQDGSRRVLEGIYFSTSASLLKQIIGGAMPGSRFRAFAGYAGWGPGQLEQELRRGDWHVLQAEADDVFQEPPSEIWPELIRRAESKWVRSPEVAPVHIVDRCCSSLIGRFRVTARRSTAISGQ